MTILSVTQNVCLAVGLAKPSAVFTSTDRKLVEMQLVANNAALEIIRSYDWQKLRKVATFTGDGSAEDFDLPTDYRRMLKKASLWNSRYLWNTQHVVDTDEWLGMETWPTTPVYGMWTIYGDQLHYRPVMASGETVKFFYIRDQVATNADAPKTSFTADEDTFVLDEHLLQLCMVYLWKQLKEKDFIAELADYEQAFSLLTDADQGSKPVVSGNRYKPRDVRSSNVWPGLVIP